MCINANTSLASFLIGEISGLLLLSTNSKEKQMIGLFIMFYSFVQLFEYNIYKNNNVKLNSQLLLLNLGLQGLIFFSLMKNVCDIDNLFLLLTLITLIYILFECMDDNFLSSTTNTCIEWNFMNKTVSNLLTFMYIIMFYWFFMSKKCDTQYDNFINKAGYFFTGTAILSLSLDKFNIKENTPSFWCMSSAILAPIFLFL